MGNQNFTTTFLVDNSPEEVFNAINNVRGWWSGEIEGPTNEPGAVFTYTVPDIHHSVLKVTEFIPEKMVVWHVLDTRLSYVNDQNEWKGTDIIFEITKKGSKAELQFTHEGLVPDFECYKDCSKGWSVLVTKNLYNLITTGKDQPSPW